PEAHMRAAAEGDPCIFVPLARNLGRKAHWIELFRLGPMLLHHVREGGTDPDRGARGNSVAPEFEILERPAREARQGGHEAQCLLEGPFGMLKLYKAVMPDALARRRDAQ